MPGCWKPARECYQPAMFFNTLSCGRIHQLQTQCDWVDTVNPVPPWRKHPGHFVCNTLRTNTLVQCMVTCLFPCRPCKQAGVNAVPQPENFITLLYGGLVGRRQNGFSAGHLFDSFECKCVATKTLLKYSPLQQRRKQPIGRCPRGVGSRGG